MITVVSDTHGTDGHRLEGRTLTAVREAELVIHAGDFTTEAVLDAFEAEAGAEVAGGGEFVAVSGNNEDAGVRERLDETRVVERAGVRFVVVHGHEHDDTALSLLGRQERADVVVVGHSHEPGRREGGAVTILNPGSHADPRWYRPAHAELEPSEAGLTGRLVSPDGEAFSEFDLTVTGRE
ncbi:metallophosphoesterase [Halosimplex salinum]|uniref:metallophosphoesterase n=1 Tax=Halosimplex salinum TaxID=1710538 RepID=UPI000F49994F|nr:metallophosphoesterase [Halosimplex salinum]